MGGRKRLKITKKNEKVKKKRTKNIKQNDTEK